MDPSQKQAEPLPQVTPADLAVRINRTGVDPDLDPGSVAAIKRNRERAGEELEAIWSLQKNQHFQWFWRECVEKEYEKHRIALHSATTLDIGLAQARFLAAKEIMSFMLKREIEHRRLISPTDAQLPRLREKLRLL